MVQVHRLIPQGLLGHVEDSCGRELYNLLVLTLQCPSYLGEASHGRGGAQIALPGSPWEYYMMKRVTAYPVLGMPVLEEGGQDSHGRGGDSSMSWLPRNCLTYGGQK